jgi:branched-subunit amino acid ABC-type transport system permease component
MSSSSTISIIGMSILLIYGITKILEFYGVGINVYGSYMAFYIFLLVTYFVLPREYYKLKIYN